MCSCLIPLNSSEPGLFHASLVCADSEGVGTTREHTIRHLWALARMAEMRRSDPSRLTACKLTAACSSSPELLIHVTRTEVVKEQSM